MIYAGGLGLLLLTCGFYLCGLGFYIRARAEKRNASPGEPWLTRSEKWGVGALVAGTVVSITMLCAGTLQL